VPRVPESQLSDDPRERIQLPPYCTTRGATLMVSTRTRREYIDCLEWCRSQGGQIRENGGDNFWWNDPDTPLLSWSVRAPRDIEEEEFLDEPRLAARYRG
jgi:hypothetical protein